MVFAALSFDEGLKHFCFVAVFTSQAFRHLSITVNGDVMPLVAEQRFAYIGRAEFFWRRMAGNHGGVVAKQFRNHT